MKTKTIFLFVLLLSVKCLSQDVELRNLEREAFGDIVLTGYHSVKGKPSKVTYNNYSFNETKNDYEQSIDVLLEYYRNGTFQLDSLGRILHRYMSKYDVQDGVDSYKYSVSKNGDSTIFIRRYWWKKGHEKESDGQLDMVLKEVYKDGLLTNRFSYNREREFIYKDRNLIKIITKEFVDPHDYDENGVIRNLKKNEVKTSSTLFTYKYDEHNRRIQKKEVNTEHITYLYNYVYDEKNRLKHSIELSYGDEILNYVSINKYKYNSNNDIIERREYYKTATYESEPPRGKGETFISDFLTHIKENPDTYLKEVNTYDYKYDLHGNWTIKTFESKPTNSDYTSKYKLERKIVY
ncbi:MAG: hypothetical protein AAGD17_10165 [Bacteroidota bacterium]